MKHLHAQYLKKHSKFCGNMGIIHFKIKMYESVFKNE